VVVGGGDACVVVGDECVVVGAGAEAVVVGDAGAVGVAADDVVVGAGAEDVVIGADEDVVVGELAAAAVDVGLGLCFFLWWTCFFFFCGSCFLAFVVVGVLVAAAGVLVELLLEPPELPQPATTTAIATAEIKARFIGWTPLRSQTSVLRLQMFSAVDSCCPRRTRHDRMSPGRLSRIGAPSRPMSSRHDLKGEDGISRPDDRRR
jgi:hypothetical protein